MSGVTCFYGTGFNLNKEYLYRIFSKGVPVPAVSYFQDFFSSKNRKHSVKGRCTGIGTVPYLFCKRTGT